MNPSGLVTIEPDQTDLLEELARMLGTCFREELWYVTCLDALDADEDRKLAITQASIRSDFMTTAPYGCVHALPDHAGVANAFLRSDLGDAAWADLEERSWSLVEAQLTPEEQAVLLPRAEAMEPLSDTNWPFAHAACDEDFIYFVSIGVDPARRGSGAFGRLIKPILAYADARNLRTYLDCYTDRLEQIYGHYGFVTVERKTAPGFDLVERCMVRDPQPVA